MKSTLLVVSTAFLTALAISCARSPSAPSESVSFAGNWNGTSMDSQGETIVAWTLSQTRNSVSGTVKTQAPNPTDGSCNSCHRNKSGTVSGTISGPTLTLTMFFAAGVTGDPTPACTATVEGTISHAGDDKLTGTYSGADSCEGLFMNGTLAMARRP